MILSEAIAHLEEVIINQSKDPSCCDQCKAEHKQLLVWLKELQSARNELEILTRKNKKIFSEKQNNY